jgi:hypothetical protein
MIMREVTIQAEYTSEDGLIFWVRGWSRDKKINKVEMVGLGHETISEAIKHAKEMLKRGR